LISVILDAVSQVISNELKNLKYFITNTKQIKPDCKNEIWTERPICDQPIWIMLYTIENYISAAGVCVRDVEDVGQVGSKRRMANPK